MLKRRTLLHCAGALVLAGLLPVAHAAPDSVSFFRAVAVDNARGVKSMLEEGFDINARSEDGQRAIYIALREGCDGVIEVLLAHPKLDVDARNEAGETPLMMAALRGNVPAMQRLLQRGAAVHFPGWSPILYAATGGGPDAAALLLDRGAPVEATSPNGSTPLMMAAGYGREDTLNLLLRRGADINKRNDLGLTVADFAERAERDKLVEALRARMAKTPPSSAPSPAR